MFCKHCGNQSDVGAQNCAKCSKILETVNEVKTTSNITPATLYTPAGIWKRLINHLIDRVLDMVVVVAITIFIVSMILQGNGDSIWLSLIILILYLSYFVVSETVWQKTPAKFITKTKVVMKDGSKPPLKNIIGRTLARLIPFEYLSFLFGKYPVGWHDKISGTMVVQDSYTESDVKSIDFDRIKKEKGNGATAGIIVVVAVLVVVAIIGILSSVVLVSLQAAKQKAVNAQAREYLGQILTASEYYYARIASDTVTTNCSDGLYTDRGMQDIIWFLNELNEKDNKCFENGKTFAVSIPKGRVSGNLCVDNTGYNGWGVARYKDGIAYCERE